jgi:hypothetical protein
MSYYLIDFTSENNDFNFDNLIIGKKIKINQDNSKYYIYYQNGESDVPKEIYIRLPIIRLIYQMGNYKYSQISLPIYPTWNGTTIFINFIKKLEQDIEDYFHKKNTKNTKKEWSSLINKNNLLNLIKTRINDDIKITSNIENEKITLNDFKVNGQIDMVIKLSYIWSNSNKIGLSSHIYQIKYLAPPEQLNINFIDPEVPIKPIYSLSNSPKISNYKPIVMSELPSTKRMPTQIQLKDLHKAIKDLKPILIKTNVSS